MDSQVPSRLGDDGQAAVRPLTGRLPESGERVEGIRLRGRELAERIRKTAERLQQVQATAKDLIRKIKAPPSP
ncbi:hypothetical protein ACFQX6_66140 [Streptosporangium lutulentum]